MIMITAYGTIERAVQAMKEGAYDFITKPFDLDHIALTVRRRWSASGSREVWKILRQMQGNATG